MLYAYLEKGTEMHQHTVAPSSLMLTPSIPGYELLLELALDLFWTWNHNADQIWQKLDPDLWERTHNPWIVLQTVSRDKLKDLLADPLFKKNLETLVAVHREEMESPGWFQKAHPNSSLTCVAYFSMEYMLSEALPIYSGGLGNVAGDQLKSASDLGLPVIAISLLWQKGYFRQILDKQGDQQALYPYNDPGQLPISPLRKPNGEWLRLKVDLPGWPLWLRAWEVQVGRVKLYLLDSNDMANNPIHRGITSELYGGGAELRLKQELVLGIGGWRLLEALGMKPEVCHLNEGHAAFAILERASNFMKENGVSFEQALEVTRAGNVFTTHTAVPAGFDRFDPFLMEQYLGHYANSKLDISLKELLALGRQNPQNDAEPFNMAYLAIRGSGEVNGVSRLHGQVSRKIFSNLFPKWPEEEIPIGYVTNGVHMPSWDSQLSDELWTDACGKQRWLDCTGDLDKKIRSLPDASIWQMRNQSRRVLVEYARKRLYQQVASRGGSPEELAALKRVFDPNTLTLGFARRFATYKRPNMLLHDPERLLHILTNAQRPVQLIIAGKAHPADVPGQAMIHQWMQFIKRPEARSHVIFISDYDMLVSENLVRGVDVWVNTPRRPWEACGTSGMKVLVNGGLNLSELDGWWAEAYCPEVGWAIGDGKERGEDAAWDASEANALYHLLETDVVPKFYTRDAEGIPKQWLALIRESMARLTPLFSTNRSVKEYTEKEYLPAAKRYLKRAANKGALGREILLWKARLAEKWPMLRFVNVVVNKVEKEWQFEVQVYLDAINPTDVKVELYADSDENGPVRIEMSRLHQLTYDPSVYVYSATVSARRPASDYTARLVPYFPDVAVPLEASPILWQH